MNPPVRSNPAPFIIRDATAADIAVMKSFIFTHGPNQWNHLPPGDVSRHMDRIATGETLGVLACDGEELLGLGTYRVGELSSFPLGAGFLPARDHDAMPGRALGYVAEVVVHAERKGRGIGFRILEEIKERFRLLGIRVIYLKRHEENLLSAAIVRKAGFQEVALFSDPAIRRAGSRQTSVSRFEFEMENIISKEIISL